jgi:hypothetical protein
MTFFSSRIMKLLNCWTKYKEKKSDCLDKSDMYNKLCDYFVIHKKWTLRFCLPFYLQLMNLKTNEEICKNSFIE